MTTRLRELGTLADFESAWARSAARPLLILKHSLTCGTSAYAREEVEDALADLPAPVEAYIVPVQTGRAISTAIADRCGIRHESPQLLLIAGGEVVWHASHHRISARAIREALQRHGAT